MLNPWLLFIHKSDSPDRMTKWNNFIVTLNNTIYSVINSYNCKPSDWLFDRLRNNFSEIFFSEVKRVAKPAVPFSQWLSRQALYHENKLSKILL